MSAPSAPVALAAKAPPRSTRPPTPLDASGQQSAKTYVVELSRGRKATVAQDYAQAEEHFTLCLTALPGDARALSERGYARLLAEKLPEAQKDLTAASGSAPNSALRLQILHNLALVERKLGNEGAADAYEAERTKLKAARRLPHGVDCGSDVKASDLEPKRVQSFDEVLKLVIASHAEADHVRPEEVTFDDPNQTEGYAERLKAAASQNPYPDGAMVLWTSGGVRKNHGVIAQSGKFFVYPNLSSGYIPLCGFEDLAQVTIEGGGARPWRIQRTVDSLVRGYIGDPPESMGFCAWTGTTTDITILDATTFRGLREISAWAHPHDDGTALSPEHLLEIEWQADRALVEACGEHRAVPYLEAD